jgi:hypothetical protein
MQMTVTRFAIAVWLCWGVLAILSVLSDLKFVVDAAAWVVDQSVWFEKPLLTVGQGMVAGVTGYRDIVPALARLFGLPIPPHVVLDFLGIASLSIGRGLRLADIIAGRMTAPIGQASSITPEQEDSLSARLQRSWQREQFRQTLWALEPHLQRFFKDVADRYPTVAMAGRINGFIWRKLLGQRIAHSVVGASVIGAFFGFLQINSQWQRMLFTLSKRASQVIVYGGAAAIVVSALFSIDTIYRSLA